ncbi:MAG: serine/threonine-protein kinase [Rhodothermales bacterium]
MTPERWKTIEVLFFEALEQPAEARAVFLAAACPDDEALRAEVDALLRADAAPPAILNPEQAGHPDAMAALLDAGGAPDPDPLIPPETAIGPYTLRYLLGRGGMGAVYLADRSDGRFKRSVALKLTRPGLGGEPVRRFLAERQILASLEHPNIARLYDGGLTDDGRPYLAMEYVQGVPIDRYCDARQASIDERLRLFIQVGNAVAYAHRSLVVHRDLKPTNILVADDGAPVVKLLDFGIAKLLEASADAIDTQTGFRLMTPAYAAPEQIRGESVTTAVDVFGLGVVLYELLVGQRPHEGTTDFETARAVLETEALRPSTRVTQSGASLSAQRRTTPQRLRSRLQGDLDAILLKALRKEPAQRYPSAEALVDDIQRHLDGLPVLARQGSRAYIARSFVRRHRWGIGASALVVLALAAGLAGAIWQARQAARERDTAREVAAFAESLLSASDPNRMDDERLDTLRVRDLLDRGERQVRAELAGQPHVRAALLHLLGDVNVNLGRYETAEPLYQEALEVRLAEEGERGAGVAETRLGMANLAFAMGRYHEALALRLNAVDILPSGPARVQALHDIGSSFRQAGDTLQAERYYEEALSAIRASTPMDSAAYAEVLNGLALLYYDLGDYALAEPRLREVYSILRTRLGPKHPKVGIAANNIAGVLHYSERIDEAETRYREALDIWLEAYGEQHPQISYALNNLALIAGERQNYLLADSLLRRAVAIDRAIRGTRHPDVALSLYNYSLTLVDLGRLDEAEEILREAYSIFDEALGSDHLYTFVTRAGLGKVLTMQGKMAEAETHLRAGFDGISAQLPEDHYLAAAARRDLGFWLTTAGRYAEAEPLLLEAYRLLREGRGDDAVTTIEAQTRLAELYRAWGAPDKALPYVREPQGDPSHPLK